MQTNVESADSRPGSDLAVQEIFLLSAEPPDLRTVPHHPECCSVFYAFCHPLHHSVLQLLRLGRLAPLLRLYSEHAICA
jgi:hypothetical protein